MKTLTIFTPTYNRAYILEKAYKSLVNQTNKDFIWEIIDDGSSDNTSELVGKWQNEKLIDIKYIKKENGGKHSAYNTLCKNVETELTLLCIDSDDYLTPNAVQIILEAWSKKKKNDKGIVALCDDEKGQNSYCIQYNSEKLKNCSLSDALSKNYFKAGAVFAIESEYMKKFLYPEIKGEKFFTEAYLLYQMDEPFIWLNDKICIREFREDGLTKNTKKLFIKNPNSWYLFNKLRAQKNENKVLKIKYLIYMISFGILSKQKNIVANSPYRALTVLLYPLGVAGYIRLKMLKRSE